MGHNQICVGVKCSLQLLWGDGEGGTEWVWAPSDEGTASSQASDTDVNLDWELEVVSESRK